MSPVATMKARRARIGSHQSLDHAARSLGTRLKTLRKSQRVTLVELAKASGVDSATISRIETGKMTGTLECHLRLATALGVKITELYAGIEEARARGGVTVQPDASRGEVYVHEAGKSSMTLLTADVLRKKLMPVLITIEPGGGTHREETKIGTEKFLYLLDGALEAHVGGAVHALKRGSSLYLDASIPHFLKNVGAHPAKCLAVTTPPAL